MFDEWQAPLRHTTQINWNSTKIYFFSGVDSSETILLLCRLSKFINSNRNIMKFTRLEDPSSRSVDYQLFDSAKTPRRCRHWKWLHDARILFFVPCSRWMHSVCSLPMYCSITRNAIDFAHLSSVDENVRVLLLTSSICEAIHSQLFWTQRSWALESERDRRSNKSWFYFVMSFGFQWIN